MKEEDADQRYFEKEGEGSKLENSMVHGFIYNKNPNSENSVVIDLRTPVSKIKQLLVENEIELFVSFVIP